jgi:hypothetical protein
MVCAQLGILQRLPGYEAGANLDWFLSYFVSRHEQNKVVLVRPFGGIHIVVDPNGSMSDFEDGDYVRPAGKTYKPTYSLKKGFDHRGAVDLLREFGIEAEVEEELSVSNLQNLMEWGVSYFLASMHYCNPVSGGISSHIVVVCSVEERTVTYVDPLPTTYTEALKTVTTEKFEESFRGYGTAIWK